MEDGLITVRLDDYARLVADSERLNIVRKYLTTETYPDNNLLRLIVGDGLGGTIVKVGDSGVELVR